MEGREPKLAYRPDCITSNADYLLSTMPVSLLECFTVSPRRVLITANSHLQQPEMSWAGLGEGPAAAFGM